MDFKKLFKLSRMLLKLAETQTDKGILHSDTELEAGVEVFVEVDGELVPAEDGAYEADNKVITVKDGKVESIEDKAVEEVVDEALAEEQPKEEAPEEEQKEDKVAELEAAIAEKDAKIAELEAKVAELEEKLKEPVEDAVKMSKMLVDANDADENPAMRFFKK